MSSSTDAELEGHEREGLDDAIEGRKPIVPKGLQGCIACTTDTQFNLSCPECLYLKGYMGGENK